MLVRACLLSGDEIGLEKTLDLISKTASNLIEKILLKPSGRTLTANRPDQSIAHANRNGYTCRPFECLASIDGVALCRS